MKKAPGVGRRVAPVFEEHRILVVRKQERMKRALLDRKLVGYRMFGVVDHKRERR